MVGHFRPSFFLHSKKNNFHCDFIRFNHSNPPTHRSTSIPLFFFPYIFLRIERKEKDIKKAPPPPRTLPTSSNHENNTKSFRIQYQIFSYSIPNLLVFNTKSFGIQYQIFSYSNQPKDPPNPRQITAQHSSNQQTHRITTLILQGGAGTPGAGRPPPNRSPLAAVRDKDGRRFFCGAKGATHPPRQPNDVTRRTTRHLYALRTVRTSKHPRPIIGTHHGPPPFHRQRLDFEPAALSPPIRDG